jgi:acyl carrier protein
MFERKYLEEVVLREVVKLLDEESSEKVEVALQSGLIESGMDSLAFAVLVTRLEESLGFDPFLALEDEIFPRTVAELVDVYADNQPENVSP